MYVQKNDYKGRITLELLNLLVAEDETNILAQASKIAEDTILSFAGVLYDIPPELAKTGTDRNYYLLSLAISIALYEIFQRADDEDVPKKVIKNRDDALNELEAISKSKSVINLPAKPAPVPEDTTPPVDLPAEGGIPGNSVDGIHYTGSEFVTPLLTGLRRMNSQPRRTHGV